MQTRRLGFPLLTAAVLLAACGGRSELDTSTIVLPDGAIATSTVGSGGGSSRSSSGGATSGGSERSSGSSSGSVGTSSSKASTATSSSANTATATDAGAPGTPDTGAATDAGTGTRTDAAAPGRTVTCGTSTCPVATQECCVALGGNAGATCTAIGACQNVALRCSSAASCPNGDTCCLTFGAGVGGPGNGLTSTCRATCGGGAGGGGPGAGVRLCTTNAECAAGQRCRMTPLGLSACF